MKKTSLTALFLSIGLSTFAQTDSLRTTKEIGLVFSSLNSFGLSFKIGNENTLFRVTALSLTGSANSTSYNSYTYNGYNDTVPSSPASSLGVGLNFGIEKRKHISPKFYFYYGLVLVNSYIEGKSTTVTPTESNVTYNNVNNQYTVQSALVNSTTLSNSWTVSSGLGIVIGVAYKLGHSFSIGAELIPSVTYTYTDAKTTINANSVEWTPKNYNGSEGYIENVFPLNTYFDKITKVISYSVLNNNAAITIIYKIK